MTVPTELIIRRHDDWHLHLRDGEMLNAVTPHSANCGRALIMPNLVPPVVTGEQAEAYRGRILSALPEDAAMTPLMTLYLTEDTTPGMIAEAFGRGCMLALKLYPAGATTNSASGVKNFDKVTPALEYMAEHSIPLCVHGEVTDGDIDIFDREAVFIDRVLDPIRQKVPGLKVVMEHITTDQAVEYVSSDTSGLLAATITVQHLMLNRNDLLVGGLRPHNYCLPILKRHNPHQLRLLEAATSGDPRFFLGTDSAPHSTDTKECACGCAGCFTAPIALPCLAQTFEDVGELDNLEDFTSRFGAEFYGLSLNEDTIILERFDKPVELPEKVQYQDVGFAKQTHVTVFDPGRPIHWRVAA